MHYDIVVTGAGPAGLAFARLLAGSGLHIALVDSQPLASLAEPDVDGRDIALTHHSVETLKRIGAWERIPAQQVSPLNEARVIDGESPYVLDFPANDAAHEPLGWLVANHLIRAALYQTVASLDGVDLIADTKVTGASSDAGCARVVLSDGRELTASLLVAADTRFSQTRRHMGIAAETNDFGRVAIVCRMQHELDHENVAWECFHYGRTLAMLPMPGRASSAVITLPASQATQLMEMDEVHFNADIEQRFGHRFGQMRLHGKRYAYPLVAVHAKRFVGQRFALIGDAAVGMHPVTAHGFNLGLSGAQRLAQQVRSAVREGRDIGHEKVLTPYQSRHMLETRPLYHGTNSVVGLFTNDSFPATLVRKAVLHLSNHLPPVKWAIRHKLMAKGGLPRPPLPRLPLG
jgi:ubiquinone biosynthesis UbiH/UbiF/VisC/COQ6 family hydroxylase